MLDFQLIFDDINLEELARYLSSFNDIDSVRERLYAELMMRVNYSTPVQWNQAVRLCESLTIVGWGSHDGVEACVSQYFNGYPNTYFITPGGEQRYLDAVWMRRAGGIVIDRDRSSLFPPADGKINPIVSENIKLNTQRNWLPKCPIRVVRTLDNCYPGSRPVLDSIDKELNPRLIKEMRPWLYGNQINRILLNCAMSFYDGPHCKTNYVIADDKSKLRKSDYYTALLNMYSPEEIEREGLYLRPRYDIGPFRRDTGLIHIRIVFEKSFSQLNVIEQKQVMSQYFLTAVNRVALRQKKIGYDFESMIDDFERVLKWWIQNQ